MKLKLFNNTFRRKRKYSIKRDSTGKSARRRAFELFDKGMRPAKVAPLIGLLPKTAYRYFEDWKKRPKDFEQRCNIARLLLKRDKNLSEKTLKEIAEVYGYPVNRLRLLLQEPWGLQLFVMGKLAPKPQRQSMNTGSARLEAAIDIIYIMERMGVPPKRYIEVARKVTQGINLELKKEMDDNKRSR